MKNIQKRIKLAKKVQIRKKVSDYIFRYLLENGIWIFGLPERYDIEVKQIRVELNSLSKLYMSCPVRHVFYKANGAPGASHLVHVPKHEIERVRKEADEWLKEQVTG